MDKQKTESDLTDIDREEKREYAAEREDDESLECVTGGYSPSTINTATRVSTTSINVVGAVSQTSMRTIGAVKSMNNAEELEAVRAIENERVNAARERILGDMQ